jgi:hypothetical protein
MCVVVMDLWITAEIAIPIATNILTIAKTINKYGKDCPRYCINQFC